MSRGEVTHKAKFVGQVILPLRMMRVMLQVILLRLMWKKEELQVQPSHCPVMKLWSRTHYVKNKKEETQRKKREKKRKEKGKKEKKKAIVSCMYRWKGQKSSTTFSPW